MVKKKFFRQIGENWTEFSKQKGYIALGVVFFIISTVFSFQIFNRDSSKSVSLPSITQTDSNINNAPQQSQSPINQTPLTPTPSPAPEIPEMPAVQTTQTTQTTQITPSNEDTENQKQANLNAMNQKISSIEGAIKKANGEINYCKSEIAYQTSQVKVYQQNRDRDLQNAKKYNDAIAYKDAEQMDENIKDAKKRITHLKDVISKDTKKIADLKSQKESLIEQKQ